MLQLRQLDLQFAFTRPRALREDVQDEGSAVEHFAIKHLLEVAALSGGEFVVKNNGINVGVPAMASEFIGLASADESGGARRGEFLGAIADDFTPGGDRQLGQFVQ